MSELREAAQAVVDYWDSVRDCNVPESLIEALRAALSAPDDAEPAVCRWHQDDEGEDLWITGCRRHFRLDEGGPSDNGMKHCCYCGKPLHQVPWEDIEPPEQEGGR